MAAAAAKKSDGPQTKWANMLRLKASPTEIISWGYRPVHKHDDGSHTRIPPTAENMIGHIPSGGNGFRLKFKPDARRWDGWQVFNREGYECVDFRCCVCNTRLPFNLQLIAPHFQTHVGESNRPEKGGAFWMTISKTPPLPDIDEAFEEENIGELLDDEDGEVV